MCKCWLLGPSTMSPAYVTCLCSLWVLGCLKQFHTSTAGRGHCSLKFTACFSLVTAWQPDMLWHNPTFLNCAVGWEAHYMSPWPWFYFVLLLWMSSVCSLPLSLPLSCHPGFVATSVPVQLRHCLLPLYYVAIWQQGKNLFALWSQVFHIFMASRLLAFTLFPFPALFLLWTLLRKQSCFPIPSFNAE